jgi:S-DNA-T family DNA segregation ATPase FtsK/SpoIIIE
MPAAKTSTRSRAKTSGSRAHPKPKPRARSRSKKNAQLEQRHLDLAGLAFVALAVFLGFVLYRDRDGGAAGRELVDGLTSLVGDIAFGVPIALAAIGAIFVLRPVLPAVRPFRSGGLCLLFAAGLWLGEVNGGWFGETLETNLSTLIGGFGVSASTCWRSSCSSPRSCC